MLKRVSIIWNHPIYQKFFLFYVNKSVLPLSKNYEGKIYDYPRRINKKVKKRLPMCFMSTNRSRFNKLN